MKTLLCAVLLILFQGWNPLSALEILSVSPASVHPGNRVRLSGGPFQPGVTVHIGVATVVPSAIDDRELGFVVPPLAEGEYRLSLVQEEKIFPQPFTLRVSEPPPLIHSLTPSVVEECSLADIAMIEVVGEYFPFGSSLLLDGRPAPSEWESTNRMNLVLPPLEGGTHLIQVITPKEHRSLPKAFLVDNRPEIFSATAGEDRVNAYEVVIRGKNFLPQSTLLVDGVPISRSGALPSQTGQLRHVDCETILYTRYPYSRTPRPVTLRIINPGGQQSAPFSLTIP